MDADDPRHGTTRGYHAGCHEACCRAAMARYEKAGRLARLRGGKAIPARGAQRRIQALTTLGWTSTDIAAEAGWNHRNDVRRILEGQNGRPCTWLERRTHDTIAAVYERLSMRLPEPKPWRSRSRTMALRKGWAPPLAWDDIDNDPAPRGAFRGTARDLVGPAHDSIDEARVIRILNGDFSLAAEATNAERFEIVARWTQPLAELERRCNWKPERYADRGDVA